MPGMNTRRNRAPAIVSSALITPRKLTLTNPEVLNLPRRKSPFATVVENQATIALTAVRRTVSPGRIGMLIKLCELSKPPSTKLKTLTVN